MKISRFLVSVAVDDLHPNGAADLGLDSTLGHKQSFTVQFIGGTNNSEIENDATKWWKDTVDSDGPAADESDAEYAEKQRAFKKRMGNPGLVCLRLLSSSFIFILASNLDEKAACVF